MATYRYWMHGLGGDPTTTAAALRDAGFDCVVAPGGPAAIEAVNNAGMESWLCGGAFGLGDLSDDSVKAIDIAGKPQVWFGSGCPNNQTIRDRNLKSYEQLAATPGVKGVLVDGCRFASPAAGLAAFFTCFCDRCRDKAGKLGLDFEAMKRDATELCDVLAGKRKSGRGAGWCAAPVGAIEWLTDHPGVLDWLRFRRMCVTEHFRAIEKVIHGAGLRMGVYIFTPCLAPAVGQSYADLREFVDVFAPMIYRNFPTRPGEACLNWELTLIPEELGLAGSPVETQAMALILAWAGLSGTVKDLTVMGLRDGLPPEAVGHETAQARGLIGTNRELAPIIYIDDPLMKQTASLVRRNGADGVNFFVYKDNWPDLVRPAFEK